MASKTQFDRLLTRAGFQTYDALAKESGVARHTLWRWRCGDVPRRSSTTFATVARLLKVSPQRLIRALSRKAA
jgi:transcriptional regulator with XRE-family HTH domain